MIKKTIITMLTLTTFVLNAKAEEPLKLKSEPLASVLAFDPIPADALFYAGKPMQATGNLLLSLTSVAGVYFGTVMVATRGESNQNKGIEGPMLLAGSLAAYVGTLIWDGIGGVFGVREHNERVKKQTVSFQPTGTITPNGGYVGIRVGF